MLKLDLAELGRADRLEIDEEIPGDSPLWRGAGFDFPEPVQVHLEARITVSDEIVVTGRIRAHLATACRRCTKPVAVDVEEEVGILYSPPDQLAPEDRGGEVRVLDPEGNLLDLSEAVREELILAVPRWVECDPGCKGLCPNCGVNWNVEECDCDMTELDPRWEALRSLTEE